jgi:plastocyanin
MRRLLIAAVTTLALVVAAPAATAPVATTTVQITSRGFIPSPITIDVGDSVTWKNADTVNHQVVANGGQFASPILKPAQTYTHTFQGGGTFHYHDALHTALKGTITVKGPPPEVTLASSSSLIKYGGAVTLSGTVSNKKAGETVTLVQLPYGQTTKQVIATLQTGTGGVFTFSVTPQIQTLYQAQWKSLSESSVTVQVAPTVTFPAPSRSGYIHFYVQSAISHAGATVFLQRYTLYRQWIDIATLKLGSRSGRLLSLRYLESLVPHGRWSVRVELAQDQAGAGYVETTSPSQPIRRRR